MVVLVNPCNPTGNLCNSPHNPATLQVTLVTLHITLQPCRYSCAYLCNPTGNPAALQLPRYFHPDLLYFSPGGSDNAGFILHKHVLGLQHLQQLLAVAQRLTGTY